MIRRLLESPLSKLLLYYAALVLVAAALAALFPTLGSALSLQPLRSLGGADLAGGISRGTLTAQGGGFLAGPNLGLRTLVAVLGALALVWPIAWVYMVTKREVRYDQSVVHTIIMLPIAVTGIVIIVQHSIALAFSLAGIVAAVRFRNTLQDTKDAVYVFLAIGVGLAAGVEALPVALLVSAVFNFLILVLWLFDVGNIYAPERQPAPAPTPSVTAEVPIAKVPSRKRGSAMFDASKLLAKTERADQRGTSAPVLNPELSLLEYYGRVLALAEDPRVPVMARVRFLAQFADSLDEFFAETVGGLKQAVAEGITKRTLDGQTPLELLQAVTAKLHALVHRQYRCFRGLVDEGLEPAGIRLRPLDVLTEHEMEETRDFFEEQVLPLLTPKAITLAGGHPIPSPDDRALSLAAIVRDPRTSRDHFVLFEVSDALPRFVRLQETLDSVAIEDVIRAHIGQNYPGRQVLEVHPFRITRSTELKFDEKHATSFLEALEEELRRRPAGAIVRIEVERSMPYPVRDRLLHELRGKESDQVAPLQASDLYEVDGPVGLGSISELAQIERPDLDYPGFTPRTPVPAGESLFAVLDRGDLLVHHPYDSFEATTERFLIDAALDPDVAAMKLTLYRPGGRSAIAEALLQAAAAGKDVSVFVELKARHDERLNLFWAKELERGGIHVVSGLAKYKMHAKLALVVRRDGDRLRRYAHVGTGDYNPDSAHRVSDLGLLTADEAICADVSHLFNELTGSSRPPAGDFPNLLVAPTNMLERWLAMIDRETGHAKAGREAGIRAKLNGLADGEIIEALYRASQAGVQIDLLIRGLCALRPGEPGLSQRIRVVSTVGRFLEHAVILRFANGGSPEYYISSADWRPRNLRRRIEVAVPVRDAAARDRIDHLLEVELRDPATWRLSAGGSYAQGPDAGAPGVRTTQETLLEECTQSP